MQNPTQESNSDTATEPTSFEEIVERHADMLYSVAYRMLRNPSDAEDAVQETFLSAYRNWKRFRGGSRVSTWLYRICVNVCLMKLRKEKRSKLVGPLPEDNQLVAPDNPEREAVRTELREKLEAALDRLPPGLRVAVVLRDVQGLSNEEAAEALKLSVAAFKARLHRARVLLRDTLGPYARAPEA